MKSKIISKYVTSDGQGRLKLNVAAAFKSKEGKDLLEKVKDVKLKVTPTTH